MKRKRESDKEIRENIKQNVALNKETKKLNQKNSKETKEEFKKRRGAQSDKNKVRAQYRKDFSSELKRIRGDANVSVLQYFDEEENKEEQEQHIKHTAPSSSTHTAVSDTKGALLTDNITVGETLMDDYIKSLPSCDQSFFGMKATGESILESEENNSKKTLMNHDVGGDRGSKIDWDDVFQTVNCLYAFNDYLQLQMPVKLDSLVERVSSISSVRTSTTDTQGDVNSRVEEQSQSQSPVKHSTSQDENGVGTGAGSGVRADSTPTSAVDNMSPAGKVERSEEEEDEWDEDDDKTKKLRVKHSEQHIDSLDDREGGGGGLGLGLGGRSSSVGLLDAQADLDRIHLCLINSITADLQSHLDLQESDKGCAVKFPLNQVWNTRIRFIYSRVFTQNHGNSSYFWCLKD